MKKDTRIMIGISLCLIVLAGALLFWKQATTSKQNTAYQGTYREDMAGEIMTTSEDTAPVLTDAPKSSATPDMAECAVYISGAVKHPGLYRYSGQARVNDAIEAVGGFTENASTDDINLAQVLTDGEQITVLTKKEAAARKKEKAAGASDKSKEQQDGTDGNDSALININTASLDELTTLPGVGQVKANQILDYRTEHGSFSKKEDLMNISGIKEGVYNKIKDLITI
ncbi:MAG: helix-hairpin-helix domain-containing protein [Butyribacter sp.]|nr:helix-hairpin-helix domain-containing protein [bacterium]MDY3853547.1 helix-hairpin-helix domain-containing protein [Butyribacter sp.]